MLISRSLLKTSLAFPFFFLLVVVSLKTSLPFLFLFFFLQCLYWNTQHVCLVFLSVPLAIAAKLTTSASRGFLNVTDNHFLWCQLKHCCAGSIFSAVWMWHAFWLATACTLHRVKWSTFRFTCSCGLPMRGDLRTVIHYLLGCKIVSPLLPLWSKWFVYFSLKHVLNTTSWSPHEALWRSVAMLNVLHQYFESWFGLPRSAYVTLRLETQLTMALSSMPFSPHLASSTLDVGQECEIYLSVCGRYTMYFGFPPVQLLTSWFRL